MLKQDQQAPEFTLSSWRGEQQSLAEILAAGPAVVSFFKVSCPVCQYTFPFLERLHQAAAPGSLRVIGISQDSAADTAGFLREYGVSFPVLLDEQDAGYEVSNSFGITVVPSTFLVEPDGRISWTLDGFARKDIEQLGKRVGASPFRPDEYVAELKAG